MTTRQMIILLQAKGYQIRYIGRPDGGVRIKEINGQVFKLSEGNRKARQLLSKPLTAGQLAQRNASRRKMQKGRSKVLSKAHKETRKTRKKAGASPKQIAKYQQEYQEEQQDYIKQRKLGKTAAQARKALRRRAKVMTSPTRQHNQYWKEKSRPARAETFPDITELLRFFHFEDTLSLLINFRPNRKPEETTARETRNNEANSTLYRYKRQETDDGRKFIYEQEVVPFENRLRKFLEARVGKKAVRPLGDLLTFLYVNHQTRLYNPFRQKYRSGKVQDSEIQLINDTLKQVYERKEINYRKLLSQNLIDVIKTIVNR